MNARHPSIFVIALSLTTSACSDSDSGDDEPFASWGSTAADTGTSDDGLDGVDDGASDVADGGDASGGSDDGPAPGCADADADGSFDLACGGDDCDDTDAAIHPGADDNDQYAWRYDSPGTTCGGPLAVDATGVVHMLCAPEPTGGGLRHATNPTGLWTNEEIEPSPAAAATLALDAAGEVHVAYYVAAGQEVRHASTSGGRWSVDVVETGLWVQRTAIAVDDAGVVHVAYAVGGGNEPAHVRYASNATGVFLSEHVEDVETLFNGTVVGIVIASDGAHLVYRDAMGALRHAQRSGLGWAMETIATAGMPGPDAFVVAPTGTLHLAYTAGGVHVAQRGANGWTTEEVAPQSLEGVDIALGTDGRRHLVFRETLGTHYALETERGWEIEPIDSPGNPSIGVDTDGGIHLAIDRAATAMGFGYARRIPGDGIDQDCDGVDGVDADGDGHASVATGGGDCDDERDWVHPGAEDAPDDGLDQDCDGQGGA
jgi:hypothetical protein